MSNQTNQTNQGTIDTTDPYAIISGLNAGNSYIFTITAKNSQGNSAPVATPPLVIGSGSVYVAPVDTGGSGGSSGGGSSGGGSSGGGSSGGGSSGGGSSAGGSSGGGSSGGSSGGGTSGGGSGGGSSGGGSGGSGGSGGGSSGPVNTDPPTAPTITAESANNAAVITWNPPSSVGGSPIRSYKITWTPNPPPVRPILSSSSQRYTILSLRNNIQYTVKILAYNDYGISPEAIATVTPRPVANSPVITSTIHGDRFVRLKWTVDTPFGVAQPIAFRIFQRIGSPTATETFINITSSSTRSHRIPSLQNGTIHYFRIVAYNLSSFQGNSPTSRVVSATPNTVPPDSIPGSHIQTEAKDSSMIVKWIVPYNGGSPIIRYIITATDSSGNRIIFQIPVDTANPTQAELDLLAIAAGGQASWKINGLDNGRLYTFTVVAINNNTPVDSSGNPTSDYTPVDPNGDPVTDINTLISNPPVRPVLCPPDAVTNLASAALSYQASVSWKVPDYNKWTWSGSPNFVSEKIDAYRIRVCDNSGNAIVSIPEIILTQATNAPIINAAAGTTVTYTVTNLTNIRYKFKVAARNQSVGYSDDLITTTAIIPNVATVAPIATATPGYGAATVSWDAPTTNAANGIPAIETYTLTVYDDQGAFIQAISNIVGTLTQYIVPNLVNDTTYGFTVIAVNSAGSSQASILVQATPAIQPPDKVTSVLATAVSTGYEIRISWRVPPFDGGSVITGYAIYSYDTVAASYDTTGSKTYEITAASQLMPLTQSNWNTPGQTLSYSIPDTSGTIPRKEYKYTVISINAEGSLTSLTTSTANPVPTLLDNAITTSAVTTLTITDTPTAPEAVASYSSAAITWTAPQNNIAGIPAITNYIVKIYPATSGLVIKTLSGIRIQPPVGYTPVTGQYYVPAQYTQVKVSGLTNNTSYTFSVIATNSIGSSLESLESLSVTPQLSAPDQVTLSKFSGIDSGVVISWVVPFNGGSPITSYLITQTSPTTSTTINTSPRAPPQIFSPIPSTSIIIDVTTSTNLNNITSTWGPELYSLPNRQYWNPTIVSSPAGATVSYFIPGLTNGISYSFTLTARNAIGNSLQLSITDVVPNPINVGMRVTSLTPGYQDGDISTAQSGLITSLVDIGNGIRTKNNTSKTSIVDSANGNTLYFVDGGTNSFRKIDFTKNKVTTIKYGEIDRIEYYPASATNNTELQMSISIYGNNFKVQSFNFNSEQVNRVENSPYIFPYTLPSPTTTYIGFNRGMFINVAQLRVGSFIYNNFSYLNTSTSTQTITRLVASRFGVIINVPSFDHYNDFPTDICICDGALKYLSYVSRGAFASTTATPGYDLHDIISNISTDNLVFSSIYYIDINRKLLYCTTDNNFYILTGRYELNNLSFSILDIKDIQNFNQSFPFQNVQHIAFVSPNFSYFYAIDSSNSICKIFLNCSLPTHITYLPDLGYQVSISYLGNLTPGDQCILVEWSIGQQTSILPVFFTVVVSYEGTDEPELFIVSTTNSSTSSIVVSGLTNGHAYTVFICTENAIGKSKYLIFPSEVTPTASSLLPIISPVVQTIPSPIIRSVESIISGPNSPGFTIRLSASQPSYRAKLLICESTNINNPFFFSNYQIIAIEDYMRSWSELNVITVTMFFGSSDSNIYQGIYSPYYIFNTFTITEGSSYRIYVLHDSFNDITNPGAAYAYIDVVYKSPASPSPPFAVSAIPYNTTALVSWSVPVFNGNNTDITYVVTATPV